MSDDGKTRIVRRNDAGPAPATRGLPVRQAEQTVKVGAPVTRAAPGSGGLPDVPETRKVNIQLPSSLPAPASPESEGDENRTRLYRPGVKTGDAPPDADWDPVVGWIVVVKGPGKGRAVALGLGHNGIGRGPDQKAKVDFGDDTISRETHAIVTFDPKSGKFYLTHGGQGRNLVYLNKAPVLQVAELKTGDEIELGNTVLRFSAFCSEQFKWDEA